MNGESQERFPNEHVKRGLDAWRAVMGLYTTIFPVLDAEMRDHTELDLSTYDILLHTFEAGEDGIRMTDLADRILLSKSGLTARVDKLEERSLVRRGPDPGDRRATRITLTANGDEVFRGAAKFHMKGIEKHFTGRVDAADLAAVVDVLQRMSTEIRSTQPPV